MPQPADAQLLLLNDIGEQLQDERKPPVASLLEMWLKGALARPMEPRHEARRMNHRGLVLRLLGRLPEAVEAAEQAAALSNRQDFAILMNLSNAQRLAGNIGTAIETLGEAYDVAPESRRWKVVILMGHRFAEVGADDDAIWAAEELLKSGVHQAMFSAATIYAWVGKHQLAVSTLASAFKVDHVPIPNQDTMTDTAYLQAIDSEVQQFLNPDSDRTGWALRFSILWVRERSSWVDGKPPRPPPIDPNNPATKAALESQDRVFEETRYLRTRATAANLKD